MSVQAAIGLSHERLYRDRLNYMHFRRLCIIYGTDTLPYVAVAATQVFKQADVDGSGHLSRQEFKDCL